MSTCSDIMTFSKRLAVDVSQVICSMRKRPMLNHSASESLYCRQYMYLDS